MLTEWRAEKVLSSGVEGFHRCFCVCPALALDKLGKVKIILKLATELDCASRTNVWLKPHRTNYEHTK
jgi:hypothetical protein